MNAGFGAMNAGLKFVQPLFCDQRSKGVNPIPATKKTAFTDFFV